MFIAADTGHRYVDSVYARHHEAAPVASLTPRPVTDRAELALPWSRMRWNRASRGPDRTSAPDPPQMPGTHRPTGSRRAPAGRAGPE
ncbi:hypothetical protein [Streptomyces sp. NPDC054958]